MPPTLLRPLVFSSSLTFPPRWCFFFAQGHSVLQAMVESGIPFRESTKTEVPSLMPLPTADGFDWHQRKRRRRRRPSGVSRFSSPACTTGRREAALRFLLDSSPEEPIASESRNGTVLLHSDGGGRHDCASTVGNADVGVGAGEKGSEPSGLGWLLISDWRYRNSQIKKENRAGGLHALERKRQRMQEFSEKREQKQQLEEHYHATSAKSRGPSGSNCNANTTANVRDQSPVAEEPTRWVARPDLGPGARRGRNEGLTLWMRSQRIPGVLGRGKCRRRGRDREREGKASPAVDAMQG